MSATTTCGTGYPPTQVDLTLTRNGEPPVQAICSVSSSSGPPLTTAQLIREIDRRIARDVQRIEQLKAGLIWYRRERDRLAASLADGDGGEGGGAP